MTTDNKGPMPPRPSLKSLEEPIDQMVQIFSDPTAWSPGAPANLQQSGIYLALIHVVIPTLLNAKGTNEAEMRITPIATAHHEPTVMTLGQVQAVCSTLNYSMFRITQENKDEGGTFKEGNDAGGEVS